MNIHGRHDAVLVGFIFCSLLLHFLLLYFLPARSLQDLREEKPVVVEVRPPQSRDRELDLPVPPEPEEPRPAPARRLGPRDQAVPKEIAPPGDAPEDRLPVLPAQPPQPSPPTETPGQAPRPDPADIDLNLAQDTRARLEQQAERKHRKDTEPGDQALLDMEKDILISFFGRFRRHIYNVWNYPPQAVKAGEQGVCLLKISINRDGSVHDVDILQSSGFPTLDREAFAAVFRGASYGPLPAAYPEETLEFKAFFQYRLVPGGGGGRDIFRAP